MSGVIIRNWDLQSTRTGYDQKSRLKDNIWFRSLPSQSAQEVCKQIDKSWKSFYALVKSHGILNPHPPRFKQEGMAVTYMQNAIVHEEGSGKVRLAIPMQLKEYLKLSYDISEDYLYLENEIFQDTDMIKQIKIYPPDNKGISRIIVVYKISDMEKMLDNKRTLPVNRSGTA